MASKYCWAWTKQAATEYGPCIRPLRHVEPHTDQHGLSWYYDSDAGMFQAVGFIAARADVRAIPEALLAPNPEPPRLNSYYFSFDATGIGIIDRILQAVRDAGKAYHHTEGWMDDEGGKKTEADKIQDAANEAAATLRAALHQQGGQ